VTEPQQSEALVLVSYGAQGVVLLPDGETKRCKFRRRVGRPFCGDKVMVARADDASLVVESILPRKNQFVRSDERQRQHVIAANLDQVLIVVATALGGGFSMLDAVLDSVLAPFITKGAAELVAYEEISKITRELATRHKDGLTAIVEEQSLRYKRCLTELKTPPEALSIIETQAKRL
jgi:putative ribosome biogenesis GTPase RsgA